MNFDKIPKKKIPAAPLVVIYGGPGIGKTAFGIGASSDSGFQVGKDDHLLLNIDFRGGDRLECKRACEQAPISSFDDIKKIFAALGEQDHNIRWLCVDDLSTLEEIFVTEVCKKHNVDEIGKIEYGRGYELAKTQWFRFFRIVEWLQDTKKIGVILIAHTKIENVKDPMSESYSHHDLQMDKRSKEIIKKAVELIAFAHKKVMTKEKQSDFGRKDIVPVGESQRILTFAPNVEGFESKDRFHLPPEIPLDWDIFETELSKSLSNSITKEKK